MAFNERLTVGDAGQFSPLNLAFVGDGVYSLLVRTRLVAGANRPVGSLNKLSSQRVCAVRQSADYYRILPLLTQDETNMIRRGRNASPHHKAKNASMAEYRNATGLEALFGYLYLRGENARILELFDIIWSEDTDEK
ncbi:MAG: ribonuclease III [Defluviitaleaceae bacterium]|nr:ribonuclease III [Defluviitaleaceae bacterium]